jgi:hypothetical protein
MTDLIVTIVFDSPEKEQLFNKSLDDLCSKYSYSYKCINSIYKNVLNYAFTGIGVKTEEQHSIFKEELSKVVKKNTETVVDFSSNKKSDADKLIVRLMELLSKYSDDKKINEF